MAHTCNHSIWEAETGLSKLKISLLYIDKFQEIQGNRTCHKKQNIVNQAQWYKPIILALRRQRQKKWWKFWSKRRGPVLGWLQSKTFLNKPKQTKHRPLVQHLGGRHRQISVSKHWVHKMLPQVKIKRGGSGGGGNWGDSLIDKVLTVQDS